MIGEARDPECRLVVYGTLAPNKPNAHELADLFGEWTTGTVRGRLVKGGWGALMGYPAIVLDERGQDIAVHVLESLDLPKNWSRLDRLEGADYRREAVSVEVGTDIRRAYIYALR